MESSKFGKGLFIPPYELLKLCLVPDTIAAPLHKQKQDGKRRSQSVSLQSAMFSRTSYSVFFLKAPESVKADIWRRVIYKGEAILWQLARAEWQMLLQTSAAGQHNNRTIPLIWHLIPLSTGLQPLSMHCVLIMETHLQTISLCGMEKNKISVRTSSWDRVNITEDRVKMIVF